MPRYRDSVLQDHDALINRYLDNQEPFGDCFDGSQGEALNRHHYIRADDIGSGRYSTDMDFVRMCTAT